MGGNTDFISEVRDTLSGNYFYTSDRGQSIKNGVYSFLFLGVGMGGK